MNTGGFMGTLNFLASGVAAAAAFLLFPKIYAWSWGLITAHVLGGYSVQTQTWAPWIWTILLFWVLFSLCRAAVLLLISVGGVIALIKIFFGRDKD